MSTAADRNLLFGILALQLDFVTRDQLIAAMNAWVLQKQRPLGEVLVERGALAAPDHALLAPMVERHIARHGGDAARSLAALSSAPPVCRALAGLGDAEVRASLQHLSPSAEQVPQTLPGLPPPVPGTRYLIEALHRRGGQGEVFVARDTELNRRVALKLIQEQFADDPGSRSRFRAEGEITGRLEHPGIPPVYGMGQYADGRPFYAMRFVQGDTLLTAIERYHRPGAQDASARNLAFRDLLGRFLDVCNTVAYAHRRGVLHRDLKPHNIMLGEFGETLVIDWGMGKILGKAGGVDQPRANADPVPPTVGGELPTPLPVPLATVGGSAHGTPGYMSPEQAEGRTELGPATDVYGLGAILFHLLTGRPPLTGDDAEVIRRTTRGEIPLPRQVNPAVSRPLEAVCLKAMALRPGDRYPSAQALADDVRHWLADEPIGAWREPVRVRARRWMRRHPGRVAAACAAVLVGLLAAGVAAVLLDAKIRDLAAVNAELDQANTGLHRALARGDVLPGRREWAKAKEEYQAALKISKRLADGARKGTPGYASAQRTLAEAHGKLAEAFSQEKDPQQNEHVAAIHVQNQVDILAELVALHPSDTEIERDLWLASCDLGELQARWVNISGARKAFQKALDMVQRLADKDDNRSPRDLAIAHNRVCVLLLLSDQPHEALKRLQKELRNSLAVCS